MKIRSLLVVAATSATVAQAQKLTLASQCTGAPPDYGFESVDCINCEISARGQPWILFRSPPVVRGIRSPGPATGRLQEGDTIVAIGGRDITSREAAQLFAGAGDGDTVEFRVRRGGAPVTVRVVAESSCQASGDSRFTWSTAPRVWLSDSLRLRYTLSGVPVQFQRADALRYFAFNPDSMSRKMRVHFDSVRFSWSIRPMRYTLRYANDTTSSAAGWMGIGLMRVVITVERLRQRVTAAHEFAALPEIAAVAPGSPADSAGIMAGDTLVAIDGHSVLTADGADRFLNAPPGVPVRITVRRAGRDLTTTLVPKEPPDSPPEHAPLRKLEDEISAP